MSEDEDEEVEDKASAGSDQDEQAEKTGDEASAEADAAIATPNGTAPEVVAAPAPVYKPPPPPIISPIENRHRRPGKGIVFCYFISIQANIFRRRGCADSMVRSVRSQSGPRPTGLQAHQAMPYRCFAETDAASFHLQLRAQHARQYDDLPSRTE